MHKKNRFWLEGIVISLFILLFFAIRLGPILNETVAFTYDQGRDFLKAAEQVKNMKPTFIGPTTGIMGIFHGSWWYYALVIPYIITSGNPIGFYYFVLFFQFAGFLVLNCFLKKFFERSIRYLVLFIVATNGYFAWMSIFAGNNVMVLNMMLGFLIANFYLLEEKSTKIKLVLFSIGLFLSLIAEFEFAFGLLLIPVYLVLSIVLKKLRKNIYTLRNIPYFLAGVIVPFLPRILFEIKNGFMQTKVLIGFFIHPKFHTPKPYFDIVRDRNEVFLGFINAVFADKLSWIVFSLIFVLFIFIIRNKKAIYVEFSKFVYLLIFLLYIISTFYKDTFWGNYYEGIQYLFLFIFALGLNFLVRLNRWANCVILILVISVIVTIYPNFHPLSKPTKPDGLMVQKEVVKYIVDREKGNKYCVKVYTPPVIPHTYNYLFTYYANIGKTIYPTDQYFEGKCWFILEKDPYKFRREQWILDNFYKKGKLLEYKNIYDNVDIFRYEEIK